MTPLRLSRIAAMTGGTLRGVDVVVDALVTDTRALSAGGSAGSSVFVALKGENFDGHDHVAAAAAGGVAALLVAHPVDVDLPQLLVADTERALAALAAALQRERGTRVVAITGSNGKTSVKALVLSILQHAASPEDVYANPGNRNNEIGLPLAVIDAPDSALFAVYEMGAGKPGDIAYLTDIARPHVSLVNNIAPAHLERMGSLLAVAETKGAIYEALRSDGVAVINADDAFGSWFQQRLATRGADAPRVIRFGLEAGTDVTAREIRSGPAGSRFVLVAPEGEIEISVAMPGRHNVLNALAAASIAIALELPLPAIAAGLAAANAVAGRLVAHPLGNGAVLIDDSYNANPGSLNAAIEMLASGRGEGGAWLVLGDMRELGDAAEAMHADAGRRAKAAGLTRLYTLGSLSAAAATAFGEGAAKFESHAALAEALSSDLRTHAAAGLQVLVKGSRGSAMDRIVAAILADDSTVTGSIDTGEDTNAA
ncbi:MAG: UDP-N-acetylmuramoyl-tripeptide--D-alanyl-D-alanine ligase [Pseudomonadota bacterium]|nr:UDP-N-acetylmuramoyl-tripeptide--D-alanyl-D-alanine ligase [Pseudomonadota bacterium]